MKKKLSLILMLCFMVLGLAACGDPTTKDYYGMTYSDLQGNMQQDVFLVSGASDASILPAEALDAPGTQWTQELAQNFIASWAEAVNGLGAVQGFGEFAIATAQSTMTTDQVVHFEGRDVMVSYVYSYNYQTEEMELTDASADLVYTLGEKMQKAALNTLMGIGTVFTVLVLISLIISCFKIFPYLEKKKQEKKTAMETDPVVTQIEQREEQQLTDDLELVAVISAAIAASEGTSADGFVVRSIRRR
ncbi:MAG: OadG family transporter subunit [Roseburia sp.]